jgi:23S rRNA pseudouridine2604 synthase
MDVVRLNKYLVSAGVCSRREADRLLEAGKITVNGKPATLGQKVDGTEHIVVNGKPVHARTEKHVYLAFNKPVGVICSSDPNAHNNIIDAVHYPTRVFHIGRLDVASSGLILLTSDGDIVNRILRSEGKHEKEYIVTIDRPIGREFIMRMASGVTVLGRKTLPAVVEKTGERTFHITLVEGRNRQIRRMCEELGVNVKSLKRVRIMHIQLGTLPVGQWRMLTRAEEKHLIASAGK